MNTSNSIFKFATIRNPVNKVTSEPTPAVQPKTKLVESLTGVLSSDKKQADKIKSFNEKLEAFIKSGDFYKTKAELEADAKKIGNAADKGKASEAATFLEKLYDNIVARTITKSNTNEVFKLLIDNAKSFYQKVNAEKLSVNDLKNIQIVLPEGLIFSFNPASKEESPKADTDEKEKAQIFSKINNALKRKAEVRVSSEENRKKIDLEQTKISDQQAEIAKNLPSKEEPADSKNQRRAGGQAAALPEISMDALNTFKATEADLQKTEADLNAELIELNKQAFQFFPHHQYAQIGESYVNVTAFEPKPPIIEDDAILVYANGCYLKFPFQIADLRVIEQKTVGYLPNEIAHINNTQSGEKQEKVTRRLKRVETYDSLITEDEVTKETDTQSTEKFSLEKASSEVQTEEMSINVNASVSGTYGVVTASVDAGFSQSESSTNSNSSSQSYAKEIVQKVVDRVSHKVRSERSVRSLEEFEETVTHIIDNAGTNDKGPKSYVYRWLTKLVRATLRNYGKRLIFEITVPHPSHYYLSRAIKKGEKIELPVDPRKLANDPSLPYSLTVENITRENYLLWAEKYRVKLDAPPAEKHFIGIAELKDQTITIPEGYYADTIHINQIIYKDGGSEGGWAAVQILAGRVCSSHFLIPGSPYAINPIDSLSLNHETNQLPLAFISPYNGGFEAAVEIECKLTPKAFDAWQTKCYFAIVEAYENLKAEAETVMSEFNPNNPGLSPGRKTDLIKTELKKGALSKMFRCNPFWITDTYEVGKEYDPDCCKDNLNAEKVKFLETVFDWQNMIYELHPYFYGDKDNWANLLDIKDDDPHFEAFLQSSYATLRIPVYRDSQKEIAAINFILNNSIANYSVVPANIQHVLDDLANNTPFGYINETQTNVAFIEIKKEYDKKGNPKIFYIDDSGNEVICTEVTEFDKEGNQTKFYYDPNNVMVISEIKDGFYSDGQRYNYYFNSANEKIITHRTKTEYGIDGSVREYYSVDLGIFNIPTDLVILEKGVQDGVELIGYPEDQSKPGSDVLIPKQYSPAIIKK